MPIIKQEEWNKCVKINSDDGYGKACVDTARRVMEILDEEKDFDPHEVINRADKEVDAGGLTGFMAGMVSAIIAKVHSRGEEWKKAWNKDYGNEDAKGVINPAILEVKNK